MATEQVKIPKLPPKENFETLQIYKHLVSAHKALGQLKEAAIALPNQGILLDTLVLQEALASSEIENIVTTQDEVYREDLFRGSGSVEAKEVSRYRIAMRRGYELLDEKGGISESMLVQMYRILKKRNDGYREQAGTVIKNLSTNEIVYVPPQNNREIVDYMRELEAYINDNSPESLDPLIKMAIIHHQFESIHPFIDGNGRVGRMLNVLYLSYTGLLDSPILYLSRAINASKPEYYRLLQAVRVDGSWEEWVIYLLKAVEETAISTLYLIKEIGKLMQKTKKRLRERLPKIYSQDLLNSIFGNPYTRIEYMERDLKKSRPTVSSYLKKLVEQGFLEEVKHGRSKYYLNSQLVSLFLKVSQ